MLYLFRKSQRWLLWLLLIVVVVTFVFWGTKMPNILGEIRKDNKIKASYANIRQFESDHKIPEMEPAVQKKLDELWKADTSD